MPLRFTPVKYISILFFISFLQSSPAAETANREFLIKLSTVNGMPKPGSGTLTAFLELPADQKITPIIAQKTHALSDWQIISMAPTAGDDVLSRLQAEGKILSWQENHAFFLNSTAPNDSLYAAQWYHHKVAAADAWPYYSAKKNIILAVIDTGIDYRHPDLVNSLWVNSVEDLNGNGRLDEADLNNVDDDGNGYIDDVIGWDFTDAPAYRDQGDYLDPDNDPMDEYFSGHGTQIAGIIGAEINNNVGIAGLVPGVRIMNLRAGTAMGYLEEDDVARAVIYAIENGAQIINMSFGDIVVSPFLQDVVRYAGQMGVVMVAAAGNNGSDDIHYPAGFGETISVAATDKDDLLAGFSSWGATVDLVAPGADILSTAVNSGYNSVNGTSFSAPIVAAGAAMILGENPDLSPEEVRNILKTTCTDLGESGWDIRFGSGRIDMKKLAQNELIRTLVIQYPATGSSISDRYVPVIVTATDLDLRSVRLEYGTGEEPGEWFDMLTGFPYQVINDTLAMLNTEDLPDTTLTLRLTVESLTGELYQSRSFFYVDRKNPIIGNLVTTHMLQDNRSAVLLEFTTNELATAQVHYRLAGSGDTFTIRKLAYETVNHKLLLEAGEGSGSLEYYITVWDRAGHVSVSDNNGAYFNVTIDAGYIDDQWLDPVGGKVPSGYALDQVTDLDQDGLYEIVISRYDEHNNFGPLQVYEFENGEFSMIYETAFPALPRAWGDADGDGKMELFTGYGNVSRLLEVTGTDPLQMETVRLDSGRWAATMADTDADGKYELIFRVDQQYDIYENTGNNSFNYIFSLNNPSAGANALGPPKIVVSDLDGDERSEIVFGDYDGDLIIYENTGDNNYQWRYTERLAFRDATGFLLANRFNGQMVPQLIIGGYTGGDANYEHEFDARYWQYTILQAEGDNTYVKKQMISIFGFSDLRDFDSGLAAGPLDPENENMLILAPFPNLYLFRNQNDRMEPVWHTDQARTNTVIIHDFDGNGANEFYYNNGKQFAGYAIAEGDRPVPPVGFEVRPLDSALVRLDWSSSVNADYCLIYRGAGETEMTVLDSVSNTLVYLDSQVVADSVYFYGLKTVDFSFSQPVSRLSAIRSATPNMPPAVDSLMVISADQLQVFYNEEMAAISFAADNYKILPGEQSARSALPAQNGRSCILSFDQSLSSGTIHTLQLDGVCDQKNTPLNKNFREIEFYYEDYGDKPYITEWHFVDEYTLELAFNMPMDSATVLNPANYILRPSGAVRTVAAVDSDQKKFRFGFSADTYTGPSGVTTYLECRDLRNIQGQKFVSGNIINLVRIPATAEDVFVYPQPARLDLDWIGFANVSPDTRIDIFDLLGRRIKVLTDRAISGGLQWDLTNDRGEKVAAGIYIYQARSENITKTGKFTIVR